MSEKEISLLNNESQADKKTRYFAVLEAKYPDQFKFLERVGGITNKNAAGETVPAGDMRDWSNLKEHCLTVVAGAETLADALGLSNAQKERIAKTAVIHDWYKRVIKGSEASLDFPRAQDSDADDSAELQSLFLQAGVDAEMLSVTTPAYLDRGFINKTATLEERLLSYLDAITNNSEIVPFAERLDKAAAGRWKWLAEDKEWQKKVEPILGPGANFFDGQKAQETATQQEIFDLLKERGIILNSPDELPQFIQAEIEKHYL